MPGGGVDFSAKSDLIEHGLLLWSWCSINIAFITIAMEMENWRDVPLPLIEPLAFAFCIPH
jgi:hypothetical protein